MIESDSTAETAEGTTARLLGCSTSPVHVISLGRLTADERIAFLLEQMVSAAGAANGLVLLADVRDRLAVQAAVGIDEASLASAPEQIGDLSFGLIVHGAELDVHDDPAAHCEHWPNDTTARMALWLTLEMDGRAIGAVRIGFSELQSLDPSEIRRLGTIADHIASVAHADRLARESTARQREVERVSAVLEDIDRMKGDFLSMISHELRTPLTAIIGYTDLLLKQVHGALSDRQVHHQGAVKKAAHRLLALINDLLDLNRLESGNVALNLDTRSLLDAVQKAVRKSEELAQQRGVELRLDVPALPISVFVDPERLQQILVNLLDNAIKFTPTSGTVSVRVDQHDGQATVAVVDTGVGVPADQLDRIWDRFHQADSSTRRHFGGTGLGLALVRNLVELHGGSVAVASEGTDKGSSFSFSLPIANRAAVATIESQGPPEPVLVRAVHARTILIVDDEPDNREVISSIVQDVLGHTAVTAKNGHEALERAGDDLDLVLLDLRMPGMSGFEVARELKRNPTTAAIPIVAITALHDADDRREALAAGCVGCVTKPFSEEALAAAVSTVLALHGRHVAP